MTGVAQDPLFPILETTSGRIRGIANEGVRTFRGIPYGEDTGGDGRFRRPRSKRPWSGVRDCFGPGSVAPQVPLPLTSIFSQLIGYEIAVADGGMGEDCLNLNVWSRGCRDDGGKRPVIVILHGGGYAHSSANAALYDGSQLALEQDVVVVSVNHRLGSLGYLGLHALTGDERFEDAGFAGLLDLVLALGWIRDNAENFGGDASRVTLIGESGGGWKVTALMAMPEAKGLFHRAVVQSGSGPTVLREEQGEALAARLLSELQLDRASATELVSMDFTRIISAQARVGAVEFQPVLHPQRLPFDPLSMEGLAVSRDVPLIVSTALDDAGLFFANFDLDDAMLEAMLKQRYGALGETLLPLYRSHRPGKPAYLLQAEMITDAGFRRFAGAQSVGKARLGGAPVWTYRWDWPSPAWDGRFGATHAMDVPASLAQPRSSLLGGGVANGRRLAAALSSAIAQFAATGRPSTRFLPDWPAFTPDARSCLLLGETDRVVADPDRQFREVWEALPMPANLLG